MDKRSILERLESIQAETAMSMERAMSDESKKEYEKDLIALKKCANIIEDSINHFDVAMWSRLDVECTMENINIRIEDEAKREEFIEDVIAFMESNFDASYGVNWGVIEDAVYSIAEGRYGN